MKSEDTQVPQGWTAEEADFLDRALYWLRTSLWKAYLREFREMRQRQRAPCRFCLCTRDVDAKQLADEPDDEPLDEAVEWLDEDIPW